MVIQVPVLIPGKNRWHKVFVANERHPCKGETGTGDGPNFHQLLGKNAIESDNFFMVDVVLLSSHIADEVCKEFKEWSLVRELRRTILQFVKNIQDGLDSVLKVQTAIVRGNRFVRNYDELGIVLDVVCIVAVMNLGVRLRDLLHGVVQTAGKKYFDLVFGFVEHLL